jgi:MFS family permease
VTEAGASQGTAVLAFKTRVAIYGLGVFGNSSNVLAGILLPLWLVSIDTSPFIIGLAMGGRFVLSTLLSIHGGTLMDKLGTRRVLLVFAIIGFLTPPLNPLLPWVWAVVVFQMFNGLAFSMGWLAGQTMTGQLTHGSHSESGRLAASHRVGSLIAAPLAGVVWDLFGSWGGFAVMSLWGVGLLGSALLTPDLKPRAADAPPIRLREIMPNFRDYIDAFALMRSPLLAVVIVISVLSVSAAAIQSTFFVVYMNKIGLTGTLIGLIASTGSIMAACGALLTGKMTRKINGTWLLFITTAIEISTLLIVPFLRVFPTLMSAAVLRGLCQGLNQPLTISVASRSVPPELQGKSMGLRTTANRLSFAVMPVIFGAVVELVGLEKAFFVVCGTTLTITILTGIIMGRLVPNKPVA